MPNRRQGSAKMALIPANVMTVGYQGREINELVDEPFEARVQMVVDVRLTSARQFTEELVAQPVRDLGFVQRCRHDRATSPASQSINVCSWLAQRSPSQRYLDFNLYGAGSSTCRAPENNRLQRVRH